MLLKGDPGVDKFEMLLQVYWNKLCDRGRLRDSFGGDMLPAH